MRLNDFRIHIQRIAYLMLDKYPFLQILQPLFIQIRKATTLVGLEFYIGHTSFKT